MAWDNGITYSGQWRGGKYHGQGSKLYSKGGGYVGEWREGRRQGWGVSLYGGKWGYDRWEGPFEEDKPHGKGTMYHVCTRTHKCTHTRTHARARLNSHRSALF